MTLLAAYNYASLQAAKASVSGSGSSPPQAGAALFAKKSAEQKQTKPAGVGWGGAGGSKAWRHGQETVMAHGRAVMVNNPLPLQPASMGRNLLPSALPVHSEPYSCFR